MVGTVGTISRGKITIKRAFIINPLFVHVPPQGSGLKQNTFTTNKKIERAFVIFLPK